MIRFSVPGNPVPKQSFKMGHHGGYTPARIKAWQSAVADTAGYYFEGNAPYTKPLEVSLSFYLPTRRRMDLDNLSKAVLDGMNGIIYGDDKQIVILHLSKCYNEPVTGGLACGVYVEVVEL
jgi:Holliday junction resolvase RusA-like endonuclease